MAVLTLYISVGVFNSNYLTDEVGLIPGEVLSPIFLAMKWLL